MRKLSFISCLFLLFVFNHNVLALNTWALSYGIAFNSSTNKYSISFNLNNTGPDADAIYLFTIRSQAVPSGWGNFSFNVPSGWNINVSSFIQMRTSSVGTDKIYGLPVPQANIVGSASFTWTFENLSGPDPFSTTFAVDDFIVRFREVDLAGIEGGLYKSQSGSVNIVPEPSSLILIALGMASLSLLKKAKRKR
ncbi:MAG: PEP-CTERM sorting domain-containing protein [bacterium]